MCFGIFCRNVKKKAMSAENTLKKTKSNTHLRKDIWLAYECVTINTIISIHINEV